MDYTQVIICVAPALIWDAMLNITKGDLELISNLDMNFVFKKRYER